MKKTILLSVCLLAFSVIPLVTSAEKVKYPYPFAPQEGLLTRTEKTYRSEICLNGYWDFQGMPLPDSFVPGSGQAPDLPSPQDDEWDNIRIKIPSPWNVNGFCYNGLIGPDHRTFPSYPEEWENVKMAWMRKTVTIPSGWAGKSIKLHFEAVAGQTVVYVNRYKACENFDLFLPFTTDITDIVKPGEKAEILVGVRSQELFEDTSTSGRRIVPAGSMWGSFINGIWQDVYLEALPMVNIKDVFVKPLVSQGKISVEVTISNQGTKTEDFQLRGEVREWVGDQGIGVNEVPVPSYHLGSSLVSINGGKVSIKPHGLATATIVFTVPENALRFWTPETPNLYAILCYLDGKNGTEDMKQTRFGWREWTFDGTKYCLNGKPYELRGDSWHFLGIPQMTRRYAWAWYTAIKQMNGNAVRPHAQIYPQFYLDLADEMGICVLDETANWGSDGQPKYDSPEFWEHSKDQITRLVLRDRNHPSIFGWSVSNENRPIINGLPNSADIMPIQEQAWKEWMDIIVKNDGTRPWISGDGEGDGNGIMPVAVGHYGNEEEHSLLIGIGKPWAIGEHGQSYWGTPADASEFNGEAAYESQEKRMEGVATESWQIIHSLRAKGACYSTVFNMAWYALKPLPLGLKDITKAPAVDDDGITFPEYKSGLPGVQPERIGPYCTTFNPGYDPNLPLYETWATFDAMRAANAPGESAWCTWSQPDKSIYDAPERKPSSPYKNVVFAGDAGGGLKKVLDKEGVILSSAVTDPANSIFIIDGATQLNPADAQKIKAAAANGADIWICGITPETIGSFTAILPESLELDSLERSSLIPKQTSWTRGLNNSDFYFCEIQKHRACHYTMKGELVNEGTVLLEACKADWNRWNFQPEPIKTASILRSENECTQALPVMVKYQNGASDIYVSTLTDFTGTEKGFNTLAMLLNNAGIPCNVPMTPSDEQFFVRECSLYFPLGARKFMTDAGDGKVRLEISVFSPRDLTNLLVEPDMPELNLIVRPVGASIRINGKDTPASGVYMYDIRFNRLPFKQGWNTIEMILDESAKTNHECYFICENRPEFIKEIKGSLLLQK